MGAGGDDRPAERHPARGAARLRRPPLAGPRRRRSRWWSRSSAPPASSSPPASSARSARAASDSLLVLLAPAAIVLGIVRQARAAGAITVRTMFGVLCVYLLLGMAFAFAYGMISAVDDGRFFAQINGGDSGRLPLLQLRDDDHDRLRRPDRRLRPRQLAGGDRGADRADLPGHRGGADRLQPGAPRARAGERAGRSARPAPATPRRWPRSSARGSRTGSRRSRPSPPAWPRWRRSPSPRRRCWSPSATARSSAGRRSVPTTDAHDYYATVGEATLYVARGCPPRGHRRWR